MWHAVSSLRDGHAPFVYPNIDAARKAAKIYSEIDKGVTFYVLEYTGFFEETEEEE